MTLTRCLRIAVVVLGLGMASCKTTSTVHWERFHYAELHMATMFAITLYAPSQEIADQGFRAAFERVAALEKVMSDYDAESELSQLCRHPPGQPFQASEDLFCILAFSKQVAEQSKGAFDPTIGPMVRLWRQSRKSHRLPDEAEIAAARNRVGYRWMELDSRHRTVTLRKANMQLDLGGNGKGYAADEALKVLKQHGLSRAMVAASGDIALGDPPPGQKGWRIGIASIDHPKGGLTAELCLAHAGVSTSGDTEQFVEIQGKRYSHIVDPATGLGLTHRIGVSVVASNATQSDSLDTAISVLGAEQGFHLVKSWPRASAIIVLLDGTEKRYLESPDFDKYRSRP